MPAVRPPPQPPLSDPLAVVASARADLARGALAAAQEKCLTVLETQRHLPEALEVLGAVLHAQGRHADAARIFGALTRLQPLVAAHWEKLGTVQRALGQHAQSLGAFEHALRLEPPTAGLLYNLGALQMERLDHRAAHLALRDAVTLAPRDARIRCAYAQCCYDMGQQQAAVVALEDWQALESLNAETLVSIALLLVAAGAIQQAQPALQRLIARPPATGPAAVGFALLLERTHRLDEARAVMRQLEIAAPQPAAADRLAMSAVLAGRAGDPAEAQRLLKAALSLPQPFERRHHLLFPLASACDALGRYEEAYLSAAEGHRSQLAFLERATGRASAEQSQLWALTANGCHPPDITRWKTATNPAAENPIFVVGFPRSGTTLLEQVLDAHPLLRSMDEQPFLLQAVGQIVALGIDYPAGLGRLSDGDLQQLCQRYWDGVRTRVRLEKGQRLVDKNPMHMVLLPLIRRLFPDAHLVLALRHPCDAVLSCFLQHFRSDLALLGRDLATLARSYDRAFVFWHSQWPLLKPHTLELKYERLTAAFADEVAKLCTFLQLPLHRAMLAPGDHARARGFISTPSYTQVLEPVSDRAVGRWRHYDRHFSSETLALLTPWIEHWGYSLG